MRAKEVESGANEICKMAMKPFGSRDVELRKFLTVQGDAAYAERNRAARAPRPPWRC